MSTAANLTSITATAPEPASFALRGSSMFAMGLFRDTGVSFGYFSLLLNKGK
jgi:hypothetical protein